MHDLDKSMSQVQRISQVSDKYGDRIHSMTNEELIELELDPQDNLEQDTFRIVDIRGQRYGVGAGKLAYTGIFPIVTTAPMALYYQGKILNTVEMDSSPETLGCPFQTVPTTPFFLTQAFNISH